jgi:hypothetical protein
MYLQAVHWLPRQDSERIANDDEWEIERSRTSQNYRFIPTRFPTKSQGPMTIVTYSMQHALYRLLSTVAAPNIEPRQLLHQHISLCWMIFLHGSLCLQLQLDISSSFPPCIGPSRTSKIMKTSSKYVTMVPCLVLHAQYPVSVINAGSLQMI